MYRFPAKACNDGLHPAARAGAVMPCTYIKSIGRSLLGFEARVVNSGEEILQRAHARVDLVALEIALPRAQRLVERLEARLRVLEPRLQDFLLLDGGLLGGALRSLDCVSKLGQFLFPRRKARLLFVCALLLIQDKFSTL